MKFTVIESKWLRGGKDPSGESASSTLQNAAGERCCMGFLALACGIPQEVIQGAFDFSDRKIAEFDEKLPEKLRPRSQTTKNGWIEDRAHGTLAQEIYTVNDDPITDKVRKEKLTKLFARAGIEVEFVP